MKFSDINIGDVFTNNQGSQYTIVSAPDYRNIKIKFNDSYGHEMIVRLQRISTGEIKNPWFPSVLGVGFVGVGKYGYNDVEAMKLWKGAITRSHCKRTKERQPCYSGVSITKDWHNFQNFAKWFYEQPYYEKGYQLDKDILIRGNKVYSPDTCCLVPQEINKIFIDKHDRNRGLPRGIRKTRCGNKYTAKAVQKHVGTFSTIEEANKACKAARNNQIVLAIEQWSGFLDPRVIYIMQQLVDNDN